MMPRYCGWEGCGYHFQGITAKTPSICPRCKRVERWTTVPPYVLTPQDVKFLRMLRISPELPPILREG